MNSKEIRKIAKDITDSDELNNILNNIVDITHESKNHSKFNKEKYIQNIELQIKKLKNIK